VTTASTRTRVTTLPSSRCAYQTKCSTK
jgi:hypothetical protein